MLDIKFIRENPEVVKKALKDRAMKLSIDEVLELDKNRRALLSEVEELKAKRNKESEEIGKLIKLGKDLGKIKYDMKSESQKINDLDSKVEYIDQKLSNLLLNIPNIPHNSIPVGPDKTHNKVVKECGKPNTFDFKGKTHIELGETLGILDFPRSSKITGAGFTLYKGLGARLERGLINFMLDLHTKKHGYTEIFPPFLVNRASMIGTGQLPKLEEDMYKIKDDDLFLIPTAEVPVTNMHRDEILNEGQLPIYYCAYTACFRREAGSYGKDTKGLTRVHQFDKVELVKFVKPEGSFDELEKLLKDAEEVLQLLEIPYRVVMLATGDLSFSAAKCYDIEIWAAASSAWLEVSSCSCFTDFQARRANIKYRRVSKDNKKSIEYVHTLNGSGVALARLVISILENNQNKDGSINIPKALQPYMDGRTVIASGAKQSPR